MDGINVLCWVEPDDQAFVYSVHTVLLMVCMESQVRNMHMGVHILGI